MRSTLKLILMVCLTTLFAGAARAQLTSWNYSTTIEITETRGQFATDYQFLLYINTADLIANGQMRPLGQDIRFALDCEGNNLVPYYIESGINTDSTKVWVNLPMLNGFTTNTIYFFTGNNAAAAASNFTAVFPSAFISTGNVTLLGVQTYDWFEINPGHTVTALAGTDFGINASRIIIEGTLNANGSGFAGGAINTAGSGPGGGGDSPDNSGGSGGGGYGNVGGTGGQDPGDVPGAGGIAYGTTTGTDISMGSGGGGSDSDPGGNGGGSVSLNGFDITITGSVLATGNNGIDRGTSGGRASGAGSGGGIKILGDLVEASGTVTANGGIGGNGSPLGEDGGGGGAGGRVKFFYYSSLDNTATLAVNGGAGGSGDAAGSPGSIGTTNLGASFGAFGVVMNPITPTASAGIATGSDSVCINTPSTYTAAVSAGLTYQWSATNGTIVSGQNTSTASISFNTAGLQTVRLVTTNLFTGCNDTASMLVLVSNSIPVANYNSTAACAGNTTQFTDASTGAVSTYVWAFGDGGTSTDRNPTHTYATTGNYNVTLTVSTNFGCTDSEVKTVVVSADPIAGFTAPPVCQGQTTLFSNTSTGANTYIWDFGDGNSSTNANPSNVYSASGTYTVTLRATSLNGCVDIIQQAVTVTPLPLANFDFTNACPGTAVIFNNLTTITSGTFTSVWNFGDGSPVSTATDPTHVYTSQGSYNVTLTVTSNNGCQDVLIRTVTVYDVPNANFTASDACFGDAIQFTNTSTVLTGTLNFTWDFGNGAGSTDINPLYTYPAPGIYTVTLTARTNNSCEDIATMTINVFSRPVTAFSASATTICLGDAIDFTNTSSSGDPSWNFGDGGTSTDVSPTYTYTAAGNYTVTLIQTNAVSGCADTLTMAITVNPEPVPGFTTNDVCSGTAVQFTNTSTISSGSLTYVWDFGDGATSTDINPTHTYAGPGTYTITLTATSNTGCVDAVTGTVNVNIQPVSSFTAADASVCDGDVVQFINNSTGSGNVIYTWDFGDGSTSNATSPTYTYAAPGNYTVMLAAFDNVTGCTDTSTLAVTIFDRAVPGFTSNDVCIGSAVQFTNTTTLALGAASYMWDFGDGTTSTNINPSHTYTSIGIQTVTLTVTTNNGCTDVTTNTLIVYPLPVADFSAGSACFGQAVQFTNLSSIPFGTLTYQWSFSDGGSSTDEDPSHTFPALGVYSVTLTATSDAGCVDQVTGTVTINPNPTANFLGGNACENGAIAFTNLSNSPSGTFTSAWDFGDGNTSTDFEPSNTYAVAGNYTVMLTVTSDQGCTASFSRTVTVYSTPDVDFNANDVCIGGSTGFDNNSTVTGGSITDVFWNFGDGTVATTFNAAHTYATPGTYLVTLTITSNQGCMDSISKVVVVNRLPDAFVRALGPLAFCDGDSVELSAGITGNDTYLWSTGETTQNIMVYTTGTYSVTVTSQFGCRDSGSIDISKYDVPLADAGRDTTISMGFSVPLAAGGGVSYQWSPAEGLNVTDNQYPVATPLQTTTYTVTVTDANGCTATDDVTITVVEDFTLGINNTFTPNGDGKNDTWFITNVITYSTVEVLIFDRWGTKVYQQAAYQNDWDGTDGGNGGKELTEGTYYYVVRFDNSDVVYKGAVSILR